MTRPQQPFLVNLFYLIICKTDMQPDGIGQLYDFLYSAFSEFGMSYHIVYLEILLFSCGRRAYSLLQNENNEFYLSIKL